MADLLRIKVSHHYKFSVIVGYIQASGYDIIKAIQFLNIIIAKPRPSIYTGNLDQNVYVNSVEIIKTGET
jgi:hypothetical protein